MRTKEQMFSLILETAQADERVRVVGMNGSRANPHARKDGYQDYDIVYVVTEMASFLADHGWVDVFGPRVIMQMPEAMTVFPPSLGGWFTYLMQFEDGNRIDLMLVPLEDLQKYLHNDHMLVILLDKDNRVRIRPEASEVDYYVKQPQAIAFEERCNEFWWLTPYVAKGLCRKQLVYAAQHANILRDQLLVMLEWLAGLRGGGEVNPGSAGKYLERYLAPEEWQALLQTYRFTNEAEGWDTLFLMMRLFESSAREVAQGNVLVYPGFAEKTEAYVKNLYETRPK